MSEAAVAAPPAPETTTPPPTPVVGGIDKLMGDFNAAVAPKKEDKPKQVEKPKEEPKGDGAKAAKTVEKPAKDTPTTVDWKTAPDQFRKEHESLKQTSAAKIADYEAKIKAIDSKPKESHGDAKLVEQYQGRVKALEQELAQSAYERSTEFRTQYVDKWNNTYKAAVAEITQLTVATGEGDDRKERAATAADFVHILNLPLKEQGAAARRLFGDSADAVLSYRNDLNRIKKDSEEALEKAKSTYDTASKEKELANKKQQETFVSTKDAALQELRTKHANFFGDVADDQEGNAALKGGYEFVDNAVKRMEAGEMSLEEQAIHTALIHARAAGFQREVLRGNRLTEKVKSLEDELSKFRKSDPGGGEGGGGGGGERKEKVGGIAGMTAKFDA